jgi:predicted ester cyclase
MSVEQNRAVIEELFDGLNKGNLAVLDECLADNFVRHTPGSPDMSREGYKQPLAGMGIGAPGGDFHSTIDEMVCQGEIVAFRCTFRQTHSVPILGIPPTGEPIAVSEAYFSRFENGKITEWWCLVDLLGLFQQLGVVPPMPAH